MPSGKTWDRVVNGREERGKSYVLEYITKWPFLDSTGSILHFTGDLLRSCTCLRFNKKKRLFAKKLCETFEICLSRFRSGTIKQCCTLSKNCIPYPLRCFSSKGLREKLDNVTFSSFFSCHTTDWMPPLLKNVFRTWDPMQRCVCCSKRKLA